ncbi:MAG: DUF4445 domain-containing protein [Deltaproteobacteria bacterium]|nr:DUF4445 domain-containing protein [Candidatus Zymogenaceae bacterium]
MSHYTITIRPEGSRRVAKRGAGFLDIMRGSDILVNLPCGGEGRCGGCRVTVIDGAAPPTPEDIRHIPRPEIDKGVRLACRLIVTGDMVVEIPASARVAGTGASWDEVHVLSDRPVPADGLSLAVDLGTTSIAAALISRPDGDVLAHASALNPQAAFGADVISRINAVIKDHATLSRQQRMAADAIAELLEKLSRRLGFSAAHIHEVVVAGNPTMEHLFLGQDPTPIAYAPFTPGFLKAQRSDASRLGFDIQPAPSVWVFPVLSGYVGGDTMAFIWSSRIHESDEMILGLDIGTNGEIVLGNRKRLLACSTAAGPAFEGSHIMDGMRADFGAIEAVAIQRDKVNLAVKGKTSPRGICGSGLFDAVSEMRRNGLIDRTGRITSDTASRGLRKRVVRDNGTTRFILSTDRSRSIGISQKDIREIQLAKGAMHAGMRVLLTEMGVQWNDIDRILVAGAFGNYLKPESIVGVGMLPASLVEKIVFVGDAALSGAIEAARSDGAKEGIEDLAGRVDYIELSADRRFNDLFISSLLFEDSSV